MDLLRYQLANVEVLAIEQLYNDRGVSICFRKNGNQNLFNFFWKGRELYFQFKFYDLKKESWKILNSWEGFEKFYDENEITWLESLKEAGLVEKFQDKGKESKTDINLILLNEYKKLEKLNGGKKSESKLKRKVKNIQQDLKKIDEALEIYNFIDGLNFEDLQEKYSYKNFKIKFGYGLTSFEKRDKLFDKLKKLKIAQKTQIKRFKESQEKLKNSSMGDDDTQFSKSLDITKPFWRMDKSKQKQSVASKSENYHEYLLPSGFRFVVGMNTSGNDEIRNKWAKKNDLWFHLDGDKSAHLICKAELLSQLTQEEVEILASCLSDYSRDDKMEVSFFYTQVKNLKGLKGQKGSVLFKKEKYNKVYKITDWKNRCI